MFPCSFLGGTVFTLFQIRANQAAKVRNRPKLTVIAVQTPRLESFFKRGLHETNRDRARCCEPTIERRSQ